MERERFNKKYDFLLIGGSKENLYYRWKVISLSNGDGLYNWRETSFYIGNCKIIPPKMINKYLVQNKIKEENVFSYNINHENAHKYLQNSTIIFKQIIRDINTKR
jgi:hypothetical protein